MRCKLITVIEEPPDLSSHAHHVRRINVSSHQVAASPAFTHGLALATKPMPPVAADGTDEARESHVNQFLPLACGSPPLASQPCRAEKGSDASQPGRLAIAQEARRAAAKTPLVGGSAVTGGTLSSAEGSGDAAEKIHGVDAELAEQVCVRIRVNDLGQLTLGAVRGFVLAAAAEFVHDLLPVDLHLKAPSVRVVCQVRLPDRQA